MDIDSDVSTAYCSSSKISSTAARFVTGVKTFEHITLALVELHWLPVPYRIVFKLLLVVYKVINGLCSALLCSTSGRSFAPSEIVKEPTFKLA